MDELISVAEVAPGVSVPTSFALAHVEDQILVDDLVALVASERQTTAAVLAHLAEVDARKLYLPRACSSMHVYCVRVLHMSEAMAFKRITAARAARRFPVLFDALGAGQLHLSAVVRLAPHLTEENVARLVSSATHKTKSELDRLLAEINPRPDVPSVVAPVPADSLAARRVEAPAVTPLAPQRFALQLTMDQATHDKLLRAQALLRHQVPSGDLAQVLDRALDALLAAVARSKFASTDRPRQGRQRGSRGRKVAAAVMREVAARDGEQCSFVSEDGVRCAERGFLEYDHREPFALGGKGTVATTRILCAAHNRYEAEQTFGVEVVQARRAERQTVRADQSGPTDFTADAMAALRGLGFTAAAARQALAATADAPAATLEARLRAALSALSTARSRPG